MMLRPDHLAISAATLAEGVAWVEALLGVPMEGGGHHPLMATHNRLLGLGDLYLEVIAIDPDAAPPSRARWFDLDRFGKGRPRLTNWICRCDDLAQALAAAPPGCGDILSLSRGDLHWQMAVPETGRLPFDGAFPALIRWQDAQHPASRLTDHGLRLSRLEIAHPEAAELRRLLVPLLQDSRVTVVAGACPALRATIATPHGPRVLE